MRVLVLGGYGLIGLGIVKHLVARGHEVAGLGRRPGLGESLCSQARWITHDLARMTSPDDWKTALEGIEVVVNAAGALQDGARDDLDRVQNRAIVALVDAAERAGLKRIVQISAPGAEADASTAFMRTKAIADQRIRRSDLDWTIFKPGLVIAPQAYGGTALVRMLAAFPVVLPIASPDARVQCVSLNDLADCVVRAVEGNVPKQGEFDLVEAEPRRLIDILRGFRRWMGVPPEHFVIRSPDWATRLTGFGADLLGHLGWRSPLRSTALRVMDADVVGDPGPWRAYSGRHLDGFEQILLSLPASTQERWFARLYFALPVMLATLSLFWIVSGIVGLVRLDEAVAILPPETVSRSLAVFLVVGGAIADIALGLAVLARRTARLACIGMIALTAAYLLSGTILTPDLWLHPLGVFVKSVPAAVLALVAALFVEER